MTAEVEIEAGQPTTASTLIINEPSSQEKFNELLVRSNTGLGSEKAGAH